MTATDAGAPEWRNWAGDQRCRPGRVERPASIAEVAAALERAAAQGQRVRVVGAGHSFNDAALTDGRLLTLERMNRVLDVDRASGPRARAGRHHDPRAQRRLAEHGLALENLGDVDAQSVAGAISTATHGTGARLRNLSSQVAALTLVLADGSTLHCSEGGPRAAARRARGARRTRGRGRGDAALRARFPPARRRRARAAGGDARALRGAVAANDHFEFYVFPHARTALTRTNNRTEEPARPRAGVSAYTNDVLLTNRTFELCCRLGRRVPAQIPRINRLVTRLAGARRRVDRSDRIFTSPRLVRFTEMEYALPRERTVEAVRRVFELVEGGRRAGGTRNRFAVPFPIEVRTVAADDALLSTAAGRDSGFVAVHMFEGMAWEPYFRAVEAVMDELGGRPHWGKRHFQSAATLRGRYPEWERFQAVRRRLDPGGASPTRTPTGCWGRHPPSPATPGDRGG